MVKNGEKLRIGVTGENRNKPLSEQLVK